MRANPARAFVYLVDDKGQGLAGPFASASEARQKVTAARGGQPLIGATAAGLRYIRAGGVCREIAHIPPTAGRAPNRYRMVRGVPARAKRLEWAKKTGLPRSKSTRWDGQASCLTGVLREHGIVLGRKLGCGSFGCAFNLEGSPDKVVKITGDPSEAAAAQHVIDARATGAKLSAVVRFFKVFAIARSDLFVVIQEKLFRLGKNELRWVKENKDEVYAVGTQGTDAAIQRAARIYATKYGMNKTFVLPVLHVFNSLQAIGVDFTDFHEGNLMRAASGRLKVIDLGISRSGRARIPQLRGGRCR